MSTVRLSSAPLTETGRVSSPPGSLFDLSLRSMPTLPVLKTCKPPCAALSAIRPFGAAR
jgi:hypothetical protein